MTALIALYDTETNGLLVEKREKDGTICPPMDRMHMVTIILGTFGASGFVEQRRVVGVDDASWVQPEGWEKVSVREALEVLAEADIRVAHNGQDFDERAIPLAYPDWKPKPGSTIMDTLVLSRLIYPDISKSGPNSHKLAGGARQRHGLKEWGIRLGEHKGDYKGGWQAFNPEMGVYGCQDTVVLKMLFLWLMSQKPSALASQIEHGFAGIIRRQESRGFGFDYDKAGTLLAKLTAREQELEASLIETFGEWWEFGTAAHSGAGSGKDGSTFEVDDELMEDEEEQEKRRQEWMLRQQFTHVIIPKADRAVKMLGFPDVTIPRFSPTTGKALKPYIGPPKMHYIQGAAYTPIKRVEFNPSSRTHIRKRLIAVYGWEPVKFTKGGKNSPPQPVVDDAVLQTLPWPEAKLLAEYYLVLKRIGMLATGKKAWMKVAKPYPQSDGSTFYRIHGRVNTNGAVTGRCTHSDPNLAQVPKNSAATKEYPDQDYLWGAACRDLFIPGPGYELVGFDGASLELRMLAHFVYPWDHGAYAKIVDEGVKEERTDPHSFLCLLIGENLLGPVDGSGRDHAKTVMYADLYGAGNEKRGSIIIPHGTREEKINLGREIGERMAEGFTAKADLQAAIEEAVETKGYLLGLDKRVLRIRKAHAALNTLLQSAGAVVMKQALIILDTSLRRHGMTPGKDYEFVANVHDEAQAEVRSQHLDLYQRLAVAAVEEAGRRLGLLCPLKAEASTGRSWKHTH